MILLGLRGQAKSRILRSLTTLLDAATPDDRRLRDQRRPLPPAVQALPRPRRRAGRRDARSPGSPPRRALRREARDPRRDHRRHHRRRGPHPGRARRARPRERAHHALRPAAAGAPRDLRPQRAARPRRAHPGGPLQHPPGGRRPDQGLPGAPAHRRLHGLHREPRGLHRARARSSRRSRTASAARSAPTTRRRSSTASRSPRRRPGPTAGEACVVPRYVREVVEGVAFAARRDKKIDRRSGVCSACPSPPSRTR